VTASTNAEIRAWARDNGHAVADRGRISAAVVAAYVAAHKDPPTIDETAAEAPVTEFALSGSWTSRTPVETPVPAWPPPAQAAPPGYDAPRQWGAPAPGPYWHQAEAFPPPPQPNSHEGFSIAALVLGILPLFGGILGIIFGVISLGRIRRTHQEGRGMAIAGIVLGACWLVAITAAAGIGLATEQDRTDAGSVIASSAVTASDLRAGDCPSSVPNNEFQTLRLVPCTEPHTAEIYSTFSLRGPDYPGPAEANRIARGGCMEFLTPYVGQAREAAFEITYLIPNQESWSLGDRSVQCLLIGPGGGKLPSGSAKAP